MRITSEAMVHNSLRRLTQRLDAYDQAQTRVATGKRILKPSDDPAGANRALSLRASQQANEQVLRNASDAVAWLNLADTQLQAGVDRLQRARDLTVRASSSVGDAERRAIAEEMDTIANELLGIANFSHRGRPLFGGHASGAAVAFDVATGWGYEGDHGVIERRVGDTELVPVNVTADEIFGFPPHGVADEDLFTKLDDLSTLLRTPGADTTAISAAIGDIDDAIVRINDRQAYIGAQTNWVDSAIQRSEDTLLSIRGELAEVEDTEYAQGIMDLQTQEMAYTATLQALAKALPPTLVSFLR